jgi:hypothetical protein
MDGEWWKKVEEAYHTARELSGEERSRFLDAAYKADVAMRRQVEVQGSVFSYPIGLGGGTGRRTGLKITVIRVFNNIRVLPKSTENIVQTHDWRGFLADVRRESGVKRRKIHRRQIGDTNCPLRSPAEDNGRHSCRRLYIIGIYKEC